MTVAEPQTEYLSEEALQIRAKPPSPKRLSRKVLMGGALAVGGVVAFALLTGLSERPAPRGPAQAETAPAAAASLPESMRALPSRYRLSDVDGLRGPSAAQDMQPDMLWGERGPPIGWVNPYQGEPELAPPEDDFLAGRARAPAPAPSQATNEAEPVAPIFFDRRGGTPVRSESQGVEGGGRREGFLAGQRQSADALDAAYAGPRSPFELQAGSVINAALVTGLNSDLPGRVIAQVTAPVYDSVTGDHLLIPQGARLIGTYDSANAHGDRRLLLVWNRLVMPNGWSLSLAGMEAADPTGAAGLRDYVDNHLGSLAGAVGLSAILSVVANEAQDDGDDGETFRQSVGDAAAQEAARVGGRIVDRDLNVRPTLRVRAGAPVRVLVTRNITLRPYGGGMR